MADLLGMFEQALLLAIVHLGDEAYGRAVLNRVEESLGRTASAGAVYSTLERLESAGMVRSRLEEGTAVRAGRARRYYKIAPAGQQALRDTQAALTGMWKGFRIPKKVQP